MAKRPYIFGHFHGSTGAVIGSGPKAFFLPVETSIQDGTNTVKSWKDPSHQKKSHVVQMMESATVKLYDLFEKQEAKFKETTLFFYGKEQKVEYYSIDLLWGAGRYHPMRFVLVKHVRHLQAIPWTLGESLNPMPTAGLSRPSRMPNTLWAHSPPISGPLRCPVSTGTAGRACPIPLPP